MILYRDLQDSDGNGRPYQFFTVGGPIETERTLIWWHWIGDWYGNWCSLNTASNFIRKWLLFGHGDWYGHGDGHGDGHSVNVPLQRKIGARIIPCRCISIKKILRVDSSRRARDTAAMLDHSRHRGESATKTVKFFVAHTVNCVICNNHTMIDWMLLNFTPVIQQNCHHPGLKFEKSFCAVDRLSCQLELSKSETSQFRSDFVFYIVNYMHVIFLHGGKMLFWDI